MDENSTPTKALAEGAKFAALTFLLCLFAIFLPPLSFITLAIVPVPTLVITQRYGFKYGFLVAIFAGILVSVLAGPLEGLSFLLLIAFLGVAQGLAVKRGLSSGKVIVVGVVAVAFSLVLIGVLTYFLSGVNLIAEQVKAVNLTLALEKKLYIKSGIPKAQVEAQFRQLKGTIKYLPYFLPSIVVLFSTWVAFLNYAVSTYVLKRLSLKFVSLPSFKDWRFPWYLAWGYILGLAGALFYKSFDSYAEVALVTSFNLLFIFGMLFMVQGLSVISFFFDKYKLSLGVRVLLFVLALFAQVILQTLSWAGLFDTWFNFRKLPSDSRA